MILQKPALVDERRVQPLPELIKYGFQLRVLNYTPKKFGNCVVERCSPGVVLTLTKDRSQVFVDVASAERADS